MSKRGIVTRGKAFGPSGAWARRRRRFGARAPNRAAYLLRNWLGLGMYSVPPQLGAMYETASAQIFNSWFWPAAMSLSAGRYSVGTFQNVAASPFFRANFNAGNQSFADQSTQSTQGVGIQDGKMLSTNTAADTIGISANQLQLGENSGAATAWSPGYFINIYPADQANALHVTLTPANGGQGFFGPPSPAVIASQSGPVSSYFGFWFLGGNVYDFSGAGGAQYQLTPTYTGGTTQLELMMIPGGSDANGVPWDGGTIYAGNSANAPAWDYYNYGMNFFQYVGGQWVWLFHDPIFNASFTSQSSSLANCNVFTGGGAQSFGTSGSSFMNVDSLVLHNADYKAALVPVFRALTPASNSSYTASNGDQLLRFNVTALPSAGSISVRFRITDANNYWSVGVDGSGNLTLVETVAGAPTTRGTSAAIVTAGAHIVVFAQGTTIGVWAIRTSSQSSNQIIYTSASSSQTATGVNIASLGTGGALGYIAGFNNDGFTASALPSPMASVSFTSPAPGNPLSGGATRQLSIDGDSEVDPDGLNRGGLQTYLNGMLGGGWTVSNFAVGGSQISDLVSREATVNASYSAANAANWLVVWAGTNNGYTGGETGAAAASDAQSYLTTMMATWGTSIIFVAMLPRSQSGGAWPAGGSTAFRSAYNSAMQSFCASNGLTYLDPTANNQMTDSTDLNYYRGDAALGIGVHIGPFSSGIVARQIYSILQTRAAPVASGVAPSLSLKTSHLLGAQTALFSLTGEQLTLLIPAVGFTMNIGSGSYVLTENSLTLLKASNAGIQVGVYSLSDEALRQLKTSTLVGSSGGYSLSDETLVLKAGHRANMQAGSYSLTGENLPEKKTSLLTAQPAAFSMTPQNEAIKRAVKSFVQSGFYSATDEQVSLLRASLTKVQSAPYALTGEQANIRAARLLAAQAASYSLSVEQIRALRGALSKAQSGAYSLTGEQSILKAAHALNAQAGLYLFTGQQIVLKATHLLNAQTVFYSVTGESLSLSTVAVFIMNIGTGNYTLTDNNLTLLKKSTQGIQATTFALTDEALALLKGSKLFGTSGAYSLTGENLTLKAAHVDRLQSGSYALTDEALALLKKSQQNIQSGTYSLSGEALKLLKGSVVATSSGLYSLTDEAVTLKATHSAGLQSGLYALTDEAVTLTAARRANLQAGAYALTGEQAVLKAARIERLLAGAYSLTDNNLALTAARRSALQTGFYNSTFASISLTIPGNFVMTIGAGAYALGGENELLLKTSKTIIYAGNYALAGENERLLRGASVHPTAALYTLTPEQVAELKASRLAAQTTSYSLTFDAEQLLKGSKAALQVGAYTLTGEQVSEALGFIMSLGAGSYFITGEAVQITTTGGAVVTIVASPVLLGDDSGVTVSASEAPSLLLGAENGIVIQGEDDVEELLGADIATLLQGKVG